MLAIACDKCRRRYTATDEELRVYLHDAEGKKYAQVLCPHCGKPSKVSLDRIHQALRFSPPPGHSPATAEEDAAAAPSQEGSSPDGSADGPAASQDPA
jgi:hypothetical protein